LGKEAIFFSLRDTLAAEFKLDSASIDPTAHIFDDLELDSLDLIELVTSMKGYTNGEIDPSVYKDHYPAAVTCLNNAKQGTLYCA